MDGRKLSAARQDARHGIFGAIETRACMMPLMRRWIVLFIVIAIAPAVLSAAPAPTPRPDDLVARADRLLSQPDDSPGRELINRLRSERYPEWLEQLRNHTPVEETISADIERVVTLAELGQSWKRP